MSNEGSPLLPLRLRLRQQLGRDRIAARLAECRERHGRWLAACDRTRDLVVAQIREPLRRRVCAHRRALDLDEHERAIGPAESPRDVRFAIRATDLARVLGIEWRL